MKRLVVAILFLLIQPAAASIIVTGNAAPPTSNLIVSHSVAINNFAEPWRWISNTGNNHRDVGQSFMLSFTTGPDANRSVNFVEDFNSGYAQGRWLARDGTPTNWGTITNDAVFFVQGLIVPEPSTFALLGLGAIGLAIRHRRCIPA